MTPIATPAALPSPPPPPPRPAHRLFDMSPHSYQINKVGTRACPPGRLMRQGVPKYAGKGGGGGATSVKKKSASVVRAADGQAAESKKQS